MTWLSSSDFQLIIRCPGKFFGNRFVPLSVGIELLLNFAHTRSLIFRLVHFVFVFVFLPSFVDNSSARVFLLGVSRLIRKRTSHYKKNWTQWTVNGKRGWVYSLWLTFIEGKLLRRWNFLNKLPASYKASEPYRLSQSYLLYCQFSHKFISTAESTMKLFQVLGFWMIYGEM